MPYYTDKSVVQLTGKYAIIFSAKIESDPNVIGYHQQNIKRVGATYWGTGFAVDISRLTFPINGYIYTTDSRKVTHVARILNIETYGEKQKPSEPALRPPEYKDELFPTYLKFSSLEELPEPMELHRFRQWNNLSVVRPPQNYILIFDPLYEEHHPRTEQTR